MRSYDEDKNVKSVCTNSSKNEMELQQQAISI